MHDRDAIGQQQRLRHVMGNHDGGQAKLAMQCAIVCPQRVPCQWIERTKRLVQEDDTWFCRQGTRHADSLTLSARQFVRKAVASGTVKPHEVQEFIDAL